MAITEHTVAIKRWQEKSVLSVVVRIDLPSDILFSSERRQVGKLLHGIVSGVEKKAAGFGFPHSTSFAGGSCKKLFCSSETACRVVAGQGACRHPEEARPSMSGFGINVTRMMQAAGWPVKPLPGEKNPGRESISWVAGLVLIRAVP